MKTINSRHGLCIGLTALGLALGGVACAQSSAQVDELTVTGRFGSGQTQSLSRLVSYADLDLTTTAGSDTLKMRIKDTARDLCRQLGEPSSPVMSMEPSCEQDAYNDAMKQARTAIASAIDDALQRPGAVTQLPVTPQRLKALLDRR